MKKFTIMALAVCLTVVMAAPVMAVDVDFSGDYRVRGFYTSHWDLRETSASNAYMNMRFELQTVFKASDILSVTTRFDALDDHVWGKADTQVAGGVDNVHFDHAYMTIKAPVGTFHVGRMLGGPLGNIFGDYEYEADRIKFVKKIDAFTLVAIYQKGVEQDSDTDTADEDQDVYYLLGIYKAEDITAGLAFVFNNDKTKSGEVVAPAPDGPRTIKSYTAVPYFSAKFGPLALQGELTYVWGKTDYDAAGQADLDQDEITYNLEATFNLGVASVQAGYAFFSGDNDANDNEDNGYATGFGDNWEKLFILTSDEDPVLRANLGGTGEGNLSKAGGNTAAGAKLYYVGAGFTPMENLKLDAVIGIADADKAQVGWKDDYGTEYDLTLNWKIYDNLTYTAIAAFLDAGDFWKSGVPATQIEDTYALFHQLELSF
jgi:hypothetical protein